MSVSRRELYHIWRQKTTIKQKNACVFTYVRKKLDPENILQEESCTRIKVTVKNFCSQVSEKWKKYKRSAKLFENREEKWLDEILLTSDVLMCFPQPGTSSQVKRGRPEKRFEEVKDQSKSKKIVPLLQQFSSKELSFAARKSLHKSGQRDAAEMIKTVTETSPKRATRIKKILQSPKSDIIKYTPDEALSLYVNCRLTKASYILMQQGAKARNANIYPTYDVIKTAKSNCYPEENQIFVSETSARISLQGLVDHTARRLMNVQEEVLCQHIDDMKSGVSCIYKWGCDGSANQSTYKQKFSGEDASKTDAYLFAVCLVPLRIQSKNGLILWQNPRPSSTRFCRPIQLIFQKETKDLSKEIITDIDSQIENIVPTIYKLDTETSVTVSHCFKMTMIDGKIFGVVSDTSSSQNCGICGASPKIMNRLDIIALRTPDETQFDHGISNLHAWIRCLECCLHIAYRLPIKRWQVRSEADKTLFKERKKLLQDELKKQMGLLVDVPKPGYGTTNDGNTARRFFYSSSLASRITGIDEELIKRMYVILKTISCGYAVNCDAFRDYAYDTAKKYVDLYPWYYMPSSLHKILIHGADIIKSAVLPIGMFSEEALESRNKDFRRYREFHTRKCSREKTMTDLLNGLLISSDPVISSISVGKSSSHSRTEALNPDILSLLSEPNISLIQDDDDDDSD